MLNGTINSGSCTSLLFYLKTMKEIGLFPVKSGVVLLADFYFHIESSKLRKGGEGICTNIGSKKFRPIHHADQRYSCSELSRSQSWKKFQ